MVGQHPEDRADTALVTVMHPTTPGVAATDVITAPTVPITPAVTLAARHPGVATGSTPTRAVRPGCAVDVPRRAGAPLPALGGEFLSAALELLCRDEPLSRAEIGDHADVVAEVADALAAVADRLVRDLDALGPDVAGSSVRELSGARDALHEGSSDSRRGAAQLWARHISELRASVERVRPYVEVTTEVTAVPPLRAVAEAAEVVAPEVSTPRHARHARH